MNTTRLTKGLNGTIGIKRKYEQPKDHHLDDVHLTAICTRGMVLAPHCLGSRQTKFLLFFPPLLSLGCSLFTGCPRDLDIVHTSYYQKIKGVVSFLGNQYPSSCTFFYQMFFMHVENQTNLLPPSIMYLQSFLLGQKDNSS